MVIIRKERKEEYRITEEIARDAFWNQYFPGANEHVVMHKIRTAPEFIEDLCLVVEDNGKIIGSIVYSKAYIVDENDCKHEILTFGPISILPEMQGKGIASQLIKESFEKAREMGFKAVVILGYPFFYERFGFENAFKFGITMPDGSSHKGLQAIELIPGGLDGICGKYIYSPCMDVTEEETEEYDKTFPPKEKFVSKSQKAFNVMLTLTHEDDYPSDDFKLQCLSREKIEE